MKFRTPNSALRIPHSALMLVFGVWCLVFSGGCYTPHPYPLQPGDNIIFTTAARANEYRRLSGNDPTHTNRVVEITRPCSVTTE